MPDTITTLPRPLMGHYVALVLDALEAFEGLLPLSLPRGLYAGTLVLAWSGPGLPPPSYCRFGGGIETDTPAGNLAAILVRSLQQQSARYGVQGLDISAADCLWLVAKLRAGALQLASADTLQVIGGRINARQGRA